MIILFFIILMCLLQNILIVFFSMPKKGGFTEVFLVLMLAPIIQLLFGLFILFVGFKGMNSYTAHSGGGFAVIIGVGIITFLAGFVLCPVSLRLTRAHKKYFVAPCPQCSKDVYWGQLNCRKCSHSFSDDEIYELKKLLVEKRSIRV
ncbi:hypothetical protein [Teredinibacter sp. KSP-S5-2]|uniref:hypothetical protein n=1 Tax=Teredinibacter sp. KSP-S5-2 TaxID=3034506 RepID=UPI0029350953|nr:hypothetical protein [Teredinibacter sp. KSP-S5-2]WNO11281.1 hypothetical protein P5V12_08865 [Teredinibacter sp. KSP-S5-2]